LVSAMCFDFVQFDLQASASKDPKAVDYPSDPISEEHATYFGARIEIKGAHLWQVIQPPSDSSMP